MYVAAEIALPQRLQLERDDSWLQDILRGIWNRHFEDTPLVNTIRVNFGPAWKARLGLITLSEDQRTTYIEINGLLRLPAVPECVVNVTVAHELVHYVHGFGSPLPRRYKYPHRGGIVKHELVRRGLYLEYRQYDNWIYNHWYDFYDSLLPANQNFRPTSAEASA